MKRVRILLVAAFSGMLAITASAGLVRASAAVSHTNPLVRLTASAAHLPPGAVKLNAVPGDQRIPISFVFKPAHQRRLDALIDDLHDPRSPRFERWLPSGAFVRDFGPPTAEVETLTSWLQSRGVTDVQPRGLLVHASGSAASIGRALGVSFDRVSLPDGGAGYLASNAPLVPRAVAPNLVGVVGLSDNVRFDDADEDAPRPTPGAAAVEQPHSIPRGPAACPAAAGAARAAGYTTADVAGRAYRVDDLFASGLTAKGKTIALLELGKSRASDTQAYFRCFRLHNRVKVIPVDGGAIASTEGTLEADIDLQEAATQAPGAAILSYEAPNSQTGELDAYSRIVAENRAQLVSTSWGQCEGVLLTAQGIGFIAALHVLFQQATTQGQSVFAATGDSGSEACYRPSDPSPNESLQVIHPASDPLVTAVGGTTRAGRYEGVWNDCINFIDDFCAASGGGAGGGGESKVFTRPSWQRVAARATCRSCRQMPDISANAGGEVFYDPDLPGPGLVHGWTAVGGTSISAPAMAGIAADIAQGAKSGRLGDFARRLTALAALHTYGSAIKDINATFFDVVPDVPGNIDLTDTNRGRYKTSPGYDLASGFGSPIAPGLACPQITAIVPDHETAGQRVTLHGVGLEKATIRFGNAVARVATAGPIGAAVLVPRGSGTVSVRASDPMCTAKKAVSFRFG